MNLKRDEYRGAVKKSRPHGYGEYLFSNTFYKYQGNWQNGKKHGKGKLLFADGSYYDGDFENDEINGYGFFYDSFKNTEYSGYFRDGEKEGNGCMKYSDGSQYVGQWCGNVPQGHGVLTNIDGDMYDGEFYNNKKHGEGVLKRSDGSRYEGYWARDAQQGHGMFTYADGSCYEGQWNRGLMHGMGVLHHISGCSYDGMWRYGRPGWTPVKLQLICSIAEVPVNGTFSIFVHCLDELNNVCELDNGRSIKLMAGLVKKDDKDVYTLFEAGNVVSDAVELSVSSERVSEGSGEKDIEEKPSKEETEEGVKKNTKKEGSSGDEISCMTEAEAYAYCYFKLKMKEIKLYKSVITFHDPVVFAHPTSSENGSVLLHGEREDGGDDDSRSGGAGEDGAKVKDGVKVEDGGKSLGNDKVEGGKSEDGGEGSEDSESSTKEPRSESIEGVAKKEKGIVTELFKEHSGLLKVHQGKVMAHNLMLRICDDEILTDPSSYLLLIVVVDVTCPAFFHFHLKHHFILKKITHP